MLQPPSQGSFVWFQLIGSRGGGATAAAVTLNIVVDESRMMADGVARFPFRLCSRDGKTCCYGDALNTIFLFACCFALLPTFFLFFFFFCHFFPASWYVYLLRVPSSVQQPSAPLSKYVFIVHVLSSCVICTLPHLGIMFYIPFSFVPLISRVAFFLLCSRTLYAST